MLRIELDVGQVDIVLLGDFNPAIFWLRRVMDGESSWRVHLFGSACSLKDSAA